MAYVINFRLPLHWLRGWLANGWHDLRVKNSGVLLTPEFVREWKGVQWYNDSWPQPRRPWQPFNPFRNRLYAPWGRDKNLPWEELARLVRQRVEHVVLFGEAAGKINAA